MHRSGTSAITRAINFLGAYLGEEAELMPATPENSEGYWERTDLWHFHDRLLRSLGRNWETPDPLPPNWHKSWRVRRYRKELKNLVSTQLAIRPLWAWKDPRTCLLLPLWRDVLAELGVELVCLFAIRHPLEVANSLNKRNNFSLELGLDIWFNYNLSALLGAERLTIAFLSYNRFLENWESELKGAALRLGLTWPEDPQILREAMKDFLRPDLRHNMCSSEALLSVPPPIQELHNLLLKMLGSAPPEQWQHDLSRLQNDYQKYTSIHKSARGSSEMPMPHLC